MAESGELGALKAAFLGTVDSCARLQELRSGVESLDHLPPPADLEAIERAAAAHALAAQALRGLLKQLRSAAS